MAATIRERLETLFSSTFGDSIQDGFVIGCGPGRTEIAGNHVDYMGGRVISASIDRSSHGLAAPNGLSVVRVGMEGFGQAIIDLEDPRWQVPKANEYNTSTSIIRGMAAACAQANGEVAGFDMVTLSNIPSGCGLSSSAAFEMLLGAVIRELWGAEINDKRTMALEGVKVEQEFFGKPCGAQDQLASIYGGAVTMNFHNALPEITPVHFDPEAHGYRMCLIDSHCDHSVYGDEYAQVAIDMASAARYFNRERLCDVPLEEFMDSLPALREALGDRIALRALHYYDEVHRVDLQREALERDDFEEFLRLVRLSGVSSAEFLQNVSPTAGDAAAYQPAMVILGLCAHWLSDKGAWRIHGGGFGGSVQAYVPEEITDEFESDMNKMLGYDGCMYVSISKEGARAKRLEA